MVLEGDGARFDATMGRGMNGRTFEPPGTYPVRELNSEIQVRVGDAVSRP